MNKILKLIKLTHENIVQSIAFLPVLISVGFLLFAFTLFSIENIEIVQKFKKNAPYLIIQDTETARTILSALIGGILSLTVFSFSMVMVVLNQASANFSPRLLPGLISEKKHQIILGFYIGTLLYCISTLIFFGAYSISSESIGISATMGALLGVACVGLFAFFIHNISRTIQINHITSEVYKSSKRYFEKWEEEYRDFQVTSNNMDTAQWQLITSSKTGYFRGFDSSYLPKDFCKEQNHIEIIPYIGQFIYQGDPLMKVKHPLDQKQKETMSFANTILPERLDDNDAISGLIKLMEVAVKAMSPGINDPGTAIDAVEKIYNLLKQVLEFSEQTVKKSDKVNLVITNNIVTADELMRIIIQPIRNYSKNDCSVMYVLIKTLKKLMVNSEIKYSGKAAIKQELLAVEMDLKENITNMMDRDRILSILHINK